MAARVMDEIDHETLARVVAVQSRKGGVGKTTLAANIAGYFALSGARVLLVDLDPQGNLEDDLGYDEDDRNDEGQSLAKALMFGGNVEALENIRPNLDVWVGGDELTTAAATMSAWMGTQSRRAKLALAKLLEPVAPAYDFIIIDCPPGDGVLQLAALAAARWLLVPSKADKSSIKGVAKVAQRIEGVLDVNNVIDLLGVVLVDIGTATVKKDGTRITQHAERGARQRIDEMFDAGEDMGVERSLVFDQTIRHSNAAVQARDAGLLSFELDERGKKEEGLWVRIRRGEVEPRALTSGTAESVANDIRQITMEINARIVTAEAAELEGVQA